MKKYVLSVLAALCIGFSLSALEWGGLATEDARINVVDFSKGVKSVTQSNGISLWVKKPISEDGKWYAAGQASYKYFAEFASNEKNVTSVLDFDLCKLNGTSYLGNNAFSLAAGRFQVSDVTGKIFSQNCDGLSLKLTAPSTEYSIYAGYTGILNSLNVKMLDSEGVPQSVNGKIYVAAHRYLPVLFALEKPCFGNNQSFNLQLSGLFDLENNPFNRLYATVMFNGPLSSSVYYNLGTTIMTNDFAKIGNLTSVGLQMFISNVVTVKIGTDYASGNNFIFKPFIGFTSHTISTSAAAPELSASIVPYLDLIITIGKTYTALSGKVIAECPDSNLNLNGFDISGNFIVNIFSDLQVGATGTMYYDINHPVDGNNYSLNINVSLSF